MRYCVSVFVTVFVGLSTGSSAHAFNVMEDNDEIVVQNACFLPLRVAVHYKNKRTGQWTTAAWFNVPPGKQHTLYNRDQQPLLSGSNRLFFFGEMPDYGLEYRGTNADYSHVVGGKKRVFIETWYTRRGFGVGIWGGFFTRLAGIDEYVIRFDCDKIKDEIRKKAELRSTDCFEYAENFPHQLLEQVELPPGAVDGPRGYIEYECRRPFFDQVELEWMRENRVR